MILSLCDYNNGLLVDPIYELIDLIVSNKHGISTEDLLEKDSEDDEVLIYKEIYQDEINSLYDELESVLIEYLND